MNFYSGLFPKSTERRARGPLHASRRLKKPDQDFLNGNVQSSDMDPTGYMSNNPYIKMKSQYKNRVNKKSLPYSLMT